MQRYQLSFAKVNILSEHIAEVIVGQDVVISLEMSEEYDDFLTKIFSDNFALLINKINEYDFSFEAKLSVASHENLAAIAVVTYDEQSKSSVDKIAAIRQRDGWNLKVFNGLNLGWQAGLDWLQSELNNEVLNN
ncbi:hypothetical protein [Colwellia psychrerythraea]|uniref:Uncharacterized protein n=1 Tax=Colwellia psychrerythraea TaxID=28229 RepID=A0A099KXI7_COLPS|nr:hypothetical protein [Colwellia psychrerythraea]KGJ94368.1 hypothetical protein ND2E_1557 [Colwellia psychrerythraea]